VRNGEGYRRKVLVGESTRIYFSKRGGGSYGQTYALRTLCYNCASELDSRNRSLAWKLPISAIMALVGFIGVARLRDSIPDNLLGSLIFAFFLFGGLGLLTFIVLSIIENISKKSSIENNQNLEEYSSSPSTENGANDAEND
jgi:hypothetical protein